MVFSVVPFAATPYLASFQRRRFSIGEDENAAVTHKTHLHTLASALRTSSPSGLCRTEARAAW